MMITNLPIAKPLNLLLLRHQHHRLLQLPLLKAVAAWVQKRCLLTRIHLKSGLAPWTTYFPTTKMRAHSRISTSLSTTSRPSGRMKRKVPAV